MTDQEFQDWFKANLDAMASMGIMHFNSERAKDVRAMLGIVLPIISVLEQRVATLEAAKPKPRRKRKT